MCGERLLPYGVWKFHRTINCIRQTRACPYQIDRISTWNISWPLSSIFRLSYLSFLPEIHISARDQSINQPLLSLCLREREYLHTQARHVKRPSACNSHIHNTNSTSLHPSSPDDNLGAIPRHAHPRLKKTITILPETKRSFTRLLRSAGLQRAPA